MKIKQLKLTVTIPQSSAQITIAKKSASKKSIARIMKRSNDGKLINFNRRTSSAATDCIAEQSLARSSFSPVSVSDQSYLEDCLKKMDHNSRNASLRLNAHVKKKLVVKNLGKNF